MQRIRRLWLLCVKRKTSCPSPLKSTKNFWRPTENSQLNSKVCITLHVHVNVLSSLLFVEKSQRLELCLFVLGQVQDAASKENELKSEIRKTGIDISELTDVRI